MNNHIVKNQKYIVSSLLLVSAILIWPSPVAAGFSDTVIAGIGWIVYGFLYAIGYLLTFFLKWLVDVASYSNFINVPTVVKGWIILRDLCNMFFVLILLAIAFGTILRIESYNYKKALPKLIVMAILINFSRTICGLVIDFGQVVMLTFVNAFSGTVIENNLANALGIQTMLQSRTISSSGQTVERNLGLGDLTAIAIALFVAIFTVIIVVAMFAMLFYRMIMLWIYVIISPMAFLAAAFPQGKSYASQWWGDFVKAVIVGPVIAFFLWLALSTASDTTKILKTDLKAESNVTVIKFMQNENFQKYIIVIGLLIGGMAAAQKVGGQAGALAGKVFDKGKNIAWKGAKGGADFLNRKQAVKTGWDFNPSRQMARIKESFDRSKAEDMQKIDMSASRNLQKGGLYGAVGGFAAKGWADNYIKGFLGYQGLKKALGPMLDFSITNTRRVKKFKDNEKELKWQAENTVGSKDEYKVKLDKLQYEMVDAKLKGDKELFVKKRDELVKFKKMESNLIVDPGQVAKKKQELIHKANKNRDAAEMYKIVDTHGKIAMRSAIADQEKKITSGDEDELISQFENALAKKDALLAAALAKKIAQVGGFNTLLNNNGYLADGGFNEEEAKKLKASNEELYHKQKGLNDFMRDMFRDKMKMDMQNVLTLQNDLGGIGEGNSHAYLRKTVGVDEATGKFYQTDEATRNRVALGENLKREPEKDVRNNNRLEYGYEDIHDGNKFKFREDGLNKLVANLALVAKEVKGNRFNRNAAKSIAQDQAMKAIKDRMVELGYDLKSVQLGEYKTFDDFEKALKEYARAATRVTQL